MAFQDSLPSADRTGQEDTGRLPGGRLHPLWLDFGDPVLEQAYRRHLDSQAASWRRAWTFAALTFFAAYGLVEYLAWPEGLWPAFAIRYGVALPLILMVAIWGLSTGSVQRQSDGRLAMLAIVHAGNLLLYLIAPYPQNDIYLFFAALTLVYAEGLTLLRVRRTGILGLVVAGAFVAAIWVTMEAQWLDCALRTLALLALFVVSFGHHYNHELATRRDFRTRRLLEEQTRRANLMVEAATAANSAKSRFLAMMSHELRTPLNAIIGFSEIIKAEMFGAVGDRRYTEYADDIDRSGRHLLAIINDLLDLSKAEAEHLELLEQHIDVNSVVHAALAMVRNTESGTDKRFIVEVAPDLPHLWADGQRLQQMLLNLLSNACKFTDSGGQIRIYAALDGIGGIQVGVSDDGIGIEAEDVERVLAPFVQVDSLYNRRYDGTGLGLPLVRALVQLHGGHLRIDSRPGEGTDVCLQFPPDRTRHNLADSLPLSAIRAGRPHGDPEADAAAAGVLQLPGRPPLAS